MCSTAGPPAPYVSAANSFNACAPARPPKNARTAPSAGRPKRSARRLTISAEVRARNRAPHDAVLRTLAAGNRIREEDPTCKGSGEPVGEAEMGVGLGQRGRYPAQPRGEHHRSGDVASRSEHHVRPSSGEDAGARERRTHRTDERTQEADSGTSRETGDREGVELVARFRNQPRLDAIWRPGERHRSRRARAALPRLRARAGRARLFRLLRSDTRAPTTSPLTAMLRRMPTPASRTTRLEPP